MLKFLANWNPAEWKIPKSLSDIIHRGPDGFMRDTQRNRNLDFGVDGSIKSLHMSDLCSPFSPLLLRSGFVRLTDDRDSRFLFGFVCSPLCCTKQFGLRKDRQSIEECLQRMRETVSLPLKWFRFKSNKWTMTLGFPAYRKIARFL